MKKVEQLDNKNPKQYEEGVKEIVNSQRLRAKELKKSDIKHLRELREKAGQSSEDAALVPATVMKS